MKEQTAKAFGKMTYGIYVLTTSHNDTINGMIASWVSQVSYDPPLIMVAVHPDRFSRKLLEKTGCFALHIPARDQKTLLQRFKGPDPLEKFSGLNWERGETGCPMLVDCLCFFECRVKDRYTPGNHILFVGEVVRSKIFSDGVPLTTLDYEGVYLGNK